MDRQTCTESERRQTRGGEPSWIKVGIKSLAITNWRLWMGCGIHHAIGKILFFIVECFFFQRQILRGGAPPYALTCYTHTHSDAKRVRHRKEWSKRVKTHTPWLRAGKIGQRPWAGDETSSQKRKDWTRNRVEASSQVTTKALSQMLERPRARESWLNPQKKRRRKKLS